MTHAAFAGVKRGTLELVCRRVAGAARIALADVRHIAARSSLGKNGTPRQETELCPSLGRRAEFGRAPLDCAIPGHVLGCCLPARCSSLSK